MTKIDSFAKALMVLKKNCSFEDRHCKNPIKAFIRQASEDSNHHSSVHYVSEALTELYPELTHDGKTKYQRFCNKEFKHEHIVPVEVIFNMMKDDKELTEEKISEIFNKYSLRATILKCENKQLDKAYKSCMPNEFYKEGHELHGEVLARYKKLGIKLVPRKDVSWLNKI